MWTQFFINILGVVLGGILTIIGSYYANKRLFKYDWQKYKWDHQPEALLNLFLWIEKNERLLPENIFKSEQDEEFVNTVINLFGAHKNLEGYPKLKDLTNEYGNDAMKIVLSGGYLSDIEEKKLRSSINIKGEKIKERIRSIYLES